MSFRAEVEVADGSPSIWFSNGKRFDKYDDAVAYIKDLAGRWTLVKRGRVVEDSVPEREPVDPDDQRIVVNYS